MDHRGRATIWQAVQKVPTSTDEVTANFAAGKPTWEELAGLIRICVSTRWRW